MAWITPPVFVALQTLTDSVMNELSSRLSDLWTATTIGDTSYASATDALSRRAIGSTGQYYGVTGGLPVWKDDGVPGLFTTAGDLTYGTGANASARLGIDSAGKVLTVNSGATAPEWAQLALEFCSVSRSSAQTIGTGSATVITFNQESSDIQGWHDNSSNTERITVLETGWYISNFGGYWAVNATGIRILSITNSGGGTESVEKSAINSTNPDEVGGRIWYMTAGQYVTAKAYQTSTGNLDFTPYRFDLLRIA